MNHNSKNSAFRNLQLKLRNLGVLVLRRSAGMGRQSITALLYVSSHFHSCCELLRSISLFPFIVFETYKNVDANLLRRQLSSAIPFSCLHARYKRYDTKSFNSQDVHKDMAWKRFWVTHLNKHRISKSKGIPFLHFFFNNHLQFV